MPTGRTALRHCHRPPGPARRIDCGHVPLRCLRRENHYAAATAGPPPVEFGRWRHFRTPGLCVSYKRPRASHRCRPIRAANERNPATRRASRSARTSSLCADTRIHIPAIHTGPARAERNSRSCWVLLEVALFPFHRFELPPVPEVQIADTLLPPFIYGYEPAPTAPAAGSAPEVPAQLPPKPGTPPSPFPAAG